MTPPLAAVAEQATVRLIPTAYYKPPVLRALVDDDEELDILTRIEGLSNQRLKAQTTGLPDLDARELVFRAWGQSHINAAFSYTRAEGNRFNDAARGAWYCAFDDLTALAEVGYHHTRELERIGVFKDTVVYHALLAGFLGDFHDLREMPGDLPCLSHDPNVAYPAGQALAIELREQHSRGIVYPSARKAGGTCLVAFHPHLVQNVRPAARWKLTWDG
ncbi:MAG: RES family NAD+ phosphorylase, partial [Rhizobiaceae bacterium]